MAGGKNRRHCKAVPAASGKCKSLRTAHRAGPKTTSNEPLPPSPAKDIKKKKKRMSYSDDDCENFIKKYCGLCDDPATAHLSVAEKYVMCGVNKSTGARWGQACQICAGNYAVTKGNLARCPNCEQNLCIPYASSLCCTEISEATHGEFQDIHSIKCPYCQHPHTFRPASDVHGRHSRNITTPVFHEHVLKVIEANGAKICGIAGKLSTALCCLKGRFKYTLLKVPSNHKADKMLQYWSVLRSGSRYLQDTFYCDGRVLM